ncbi:MAG: hypothetical protein HY654_02215, partial [Acidobacteria bacterium]|nr:hypothetical protein [Acidobacteriota bacterium]
MRGTELRHGLRPVAALVAIALAGTACGSSSPSPHLPTGPTPVRLPVVTASFPSLPLEAKPQDNRSGMRTYEISATVTLRESAGVPARLDSIEVTFVSASDFTATTRLAVEVEIAEFAAADVPVRQVFETSTSIESGVWRLTGRGTSADGDPFSLTATEVPVMVRSV